MREEDISNELLIKQISSYQIQLDRFNFFLAAIASYFFILDYLIERQTKLYFIIPILSFIIIAFINIYFKVNRTVFTILRSITIIGIICFFIVCFMHFGKETGTYIFYPFILLSIPYLIDIRTEVKMYAFFIVLLSGILIFFIYLNIFNNLNYNRLNITPYKKNIIFFTNIIWGIILSIYFNFTLINAQHLIHYIQLRNKYKKRLINDLSKNIIEVKKNDLNELKNLIDDKNSLFMSKFEKVYPLFCQKIETLSKSDKEICALSKLNLDTKQIAIFYNCTPKSIENRKYRIKKKLNIEAGIKFEKFIETL